MELTRGYCSENKKKRDVVLQLVERGYPSDPVKVWKDSQKRANVVIEKTDDDDSRGETSSISLASRLASSGPDYAYLLNMTILSFSKEKKDELLLKRRDDKVSVLRLAVLPLTIVKIYPAFYAQKQFSQERYIVTLQVVVVKNKPSCTFDVSNLVRLV